MSPKSQDKFTSKESIQNEVIDEFINNHFPEYVDLIKENAMDKEIENYISTILILIVMLLFD